MLTVFFDSVCRLTPGGLAEIADYAQWLGLDLDSEKELVWICREGLKAKLPADWKAL